MNNEPVSLVSIRHPTDHSAMIPYFGSFGPLNQIPVYTRMANEIRQLGFVVDVHDDAYDPLAAQNAAARRLADELRAPPRSSAPEIATAVAAQSVKNAEPPAQTEAPQPMSLEEAQLLRDRVSGLDSLARARELMDEYAITLDPSISKLKDIKASILALIEA